MIPSQGYKNKSKYGEGNTGVENVRCVRAKGCRKEGRGGLTEWSDSRGIFWGR